MDQRHSERKFSPRLVALVIVAFTMAAYWNSFHGPFIYDDKPAILGNPSIQHLWPLSVPLSPPSDDGTTVGGRPLLNLSLAFNYAAGNFEVVGYHVTNLGIHVLAALTLFGLVYRSTKTYRFFGDVGLRESENGPLIFSGSIALLWAVHPLLTESVTYTVQRAESLAGLFFLLTLYCFVRATTEKDSGRWLTYSIASSLLGAAAKETLATVPFIVLLFDRTFVAGSFKEAWKERSRYYLSFLLLWLELGLLVASTGFDRGGSIGFGVSRSWWAYGFTQFEAITRYVGLALWPTSLVFDYGQIATPQIAEIIPYVLIVIILLVITIWGLIRRPALGFLGATFFIILAPTSSIIPGASQMIVEHRMYLSLAAVVALVVTASYAAIGRYTAILAVGLAIVLSGATFQRNRDYRSELSIWEAVTRDFPANGDAWNNVAANYFLLGNYPSARDACLKAISINPDLVPAHYNLGKALFAMGDTTGSVKAYQRTISLRPEFAEAYNNLGVSYLTLKRDKEALTEFQKAASLSPNFPEAVENLGITEDRLQLNDAAIYNLNKAIRLRPNSPNAHNALGNVFLRLNLLPQAKEQYEAALATVPNSAAVNASLGNLCLQMDQPAKAIPYYLVALKADPSRVDVIGNIGNANLALGHVDDAIVYYQASITADPTSALTRFAYANALVIAHRYEEAEVQLEDALKINPGFTNARTRLAELHYQDQTRQQKGP